MRQLFAQAGKTSPADVTEADLLRWVHAEQPSNNYARTRISTVRTLWPWLRAKGLTALDPDPAMQVAKKQYPATYGKVQAPYPARWLTKEEAFGTLLRVCSDGTWIGSRDHLIARFGLLGIRNSEIIGLTWERLTTDGRLLWMGKAHRPREVHLGPKMLDLLTRWRRKYEQEIGRPVTARDPILCNAGMGSRRHELQWGEPIHSPQVLRCIIRRRAEQAELGHLSPHDLRRSAAGILHRELGVDGGHLFDLLDIQKVLGHADPATTQRSYLDHLDNQALRNARTVLD